MNEHLGSESFVSLGEAMGKMRLSEAEKDATNKLPTDVAQILEVHDAIHILFNCSTSIEDEIAAHLWTVLGTTLKSGQIHRVLASSGHRDILSSIGFLKLTGIWLVNGPRILGILFKSLRMKKKLAVEELSRLKKQSVLEIRQEHGIIL